MRQFIYKLRFVIAIGNDDDDDDYDMMPNDEITSVAMQYVIHSKVCGNIPIQSKNIDPFRIAIS